jgi:hypothetical protein
MAPRKYERQPAVGHQQILPRSIAFEGFARRMRAEAIRLVRLRRNGETKHCTAHDDFEGVPAAKPPIRCGGAA